jgi:hypothetical protein
VTLTEIEQAVTPTPERRNPTKDFSRAVEDHHHSVGGFLKFAEAAITSLLLSSYLNDREVTRALDAIVKAIKEARPVLDRRRSGGLYRVRPGGDAYFGDELDALHKLGYVIETKRKIHQADELLHRELIRRYPSENPILRMAEREQLKDPPPFELPDAIKQELHTAIANVVIAARKQPQLLPEQPQVTLDAIPITEPTTPDRHAAVRAALLEIPTSRKPYSSSVAASIRIQ